jgi:hypothetical protein
VERIRSEMLKQNMEVAKRSAQKYTQRPRRAALSGQVWGTFLRNHVPEIWVCDFLHTYDALFRSLFVFVIIELFSQDMLSRSDRRVVGDLRASCHGQGYVADDCSPAHHRD